MLPDFARRADLDEQMEDPSLSDQRLNETTDAIERVSRLTGGMRASVRGLERLVDRGMRRITILDVGTGNGAIPREFASWGRRNAIEVEVLGIDVLDSAVEHARRESRGQPGLTYRAADLFEMDPDEQRFDVVHASLVLHHFDGDEAVEALEKMTALSRLGVVVNDLHRHPLHWLSSKVVIPLVTENEISKHDGPVSVLRGFSRREIVDMGRRAGLSSVTVEWVFPFRWLMVGRR